jgi:tRNA G37 N-methylase Trm5
MFSSGNVTEKARVGHRLVAPGETIVDLFAGIGYFTLPALVHGRAAHVHAAEWNPDAVACLRLNLRAAGAAVERRCTVWPGDNAALAEEQPALRGAAHRVLLGLIPSSQRAWGLALRLLRPEGGVLHVHENAPDGGGAEFWEGALRPALQRLSDERSELRARGWTFRLAHCERVKSYAPRVAHYVFDVEVRVGAA